MGSSAKNESGIISGINVTPLVDITLVLLIIFMVTAKIIVTPAVPLDLPAASQSEEVQVVFSIIIPAEGPILANGSKVSADDELLKIAQSEREKDADLRVVINADGDVAHRRVIHVLDLIKTAGISKIAFGSIPEGSEK